MQDINLSIEKGDIFGIIGQSGAGKSTLIRCLATLEKPSQGQIWFEGSDIVQMTPQELASFRRKIGMIFQHFNLLSSRSVWDNIAYPLEIHGFAKEARQKRVGEMLELVDLQGKENVFPSCLSGGQKQRVGIARALASYPKVLLCDEATSALDPKTTKDILSLLKRLNRELGLTIVLITHEMDVIKQICNKIAVVDNGGVVETGLIADIFASPQHLITKQFLQHSTHELPEWLLKRSRAGTHLRLSFKGKETNEPLISKMIKLFDVDVNILHGWIESVQETLIGNLVIELVGETENIRRSCSFLEEHHVHVEALQHDRK